MRRITDLQPGESILGWLRIGFALRKERTVKGVIYRSVPSKATPFRKDDIQQFIGQVVQNTGEVLTVNCAPRSHYSVQSGQALLAEIHYLALGRINTISKEAHEPKPEYPLRPTRQGFGTQFYAYRTREPILLVW